MSDAATYRELAEAAWTWTLDQVRDDDGPWLPESVDEEEPQAAAAWDRDSLYVGISGTALALAEVVQHRSLTEREQRLADDVVVRLRRQSRATDAASLYDGLAGFVTALRHLAPGGERDALGRVGELRKSTGWTSPEPGPYQDTVLTDIIGGTAGIVLTVLWAGGAADIVSAGCELLLDDADEVEAGLDWGMVPHALSRGPNFSHGTAGIASALAVAGTALGRPDLVAAAVRGAEHLLSVGQLDEHGFVVPHTIPPSRREVEPVTYTWCHGPAGTSQLFAALSRAGVAEVDGYSTRGCGSVASKRSSMPEFRSGCGQASGTTTAGVAAPPASATCCSMPIRTLLTRTRPDGCSGRPGRWPTRSSSGRPGRWRSALALRRIPHR